MTPSFTLEQLRRIKEKLPEPYHVGYVWRVPMLVEPLREFVNQDDPQREFEHLTLVAVSAPTPPGIYERPRLRWKLNCDVLL